MIPKITSLLKDRVEAELRHDPQVGDYAIEVLDANGVITLQGQVPDEEISLAAGQLARRVEGVISVVNELSINRSIKKHAQSRAGTSKIGMR